MIFRVKVCGITDERCLEAAVAAGADAVGFNFHKGSPRFILPDRARELVRRLPSRIVAVGVFVNMDAGDVEAWMDRSGVGWAQFHGDETPSDLQTFPRPWFPALRPLPGEIPDLSAWRAPFVLIDARATGHFGGTGLRADWETAAEVAKRYRVVLAGGLGPGNLGEALRRVNPAAVDLNSGVESSPGVKDPDRLAGAMRILGPWRERLGTGGEP